MTPAVDFSRPGARAGPGVQRHAWHGATNHTSRLGCSPGGGHAKGVLGVWSCLDGATSAGRYTGPSGVGGGVYGSRGGAVPSRAHLAYTGLDAARVGGWREGVFRAAGASARAAHAGTARSLEAPQLSVGSAGHRRCGLVDGGFRQGSRGGGRDHATVGPRGGPTTRASRSEQGLRRSVTPRAT